MKHGLVYLLLVAGVVLTGSLPFASHDVGELRPVQTALVRMEADRVILKTDMGDVGAGIGWDAAMADLKAKAPGTVFFGTASFLLLEESAQDLLSELPQKMELNPGCAPGPGGREAGYASSPGGDGGEVSACTTGKLRATVYGPGRQRRFPHRQLNF